MEPPGVGILGQERDLPQCWPQARGMLGLSLREDRHQPPGKVSYGLPSLEMDRYGYTHPGKDGNDQVL